MSFLDPNAFIKSGSEFEDVFPIGGKETSDKIKSYLHIYLTGGCVFKIRNK
jgi:hypothetical protein